MKRVILFLSLGLAAAINAQSARAANPCADRGAVIDQLENRYHESRQSVGLARGNHIVEIYASEENGTWTIVVTAPNGTACVIAAGSHFEHLDPAEGQKVRL